MNDLTSDPMKGTSTADFVSSYTVERVRAEFPSLASGWALFDGPGGTQVPRAVIAAMVSALEGPLANRGAITAGERHADRTVVGARRAIADALIDEGTGLDPVADAEMIKALKSQDPDEILRRFEIDEDTELGIPVSESDTSLNDLLNSSEPMEIISAMLCQPLPSSCEAAAASCAGSLIPFSRDTTLRKVWFTSVAPDLVLAISTPNSANTSGLAPSVLFILPIDRKSVV
jgi:hypothetical protein